MACGLTTTFENNREVVKLLRDTGFDVTYWEPGIGGHEWPFWNAWIDCALDWFAPAGDAPHHRQAAITPP